VRGTGAYIKGTNGTSNGIIPMLKVFNETARYVDQCFTGDTLINTKEGYTKIEDIKMGDLVLTSDGEYHSVIEKLTTFSDNKKLIDIETDNGKNTVTEDHLFLVIKDGSMIENIESKFKNGTLSPEWIEAKNITENDILLNF